MVSNIAKLGRKTHENTWRGTLNQRLFWWSVSLTLSLSAHRRRTCAAGNLARAPHDIVEFHTFHSHSRVHSSAVCLVLVLHEYAYCSHPSSSIPLFFLPDRDVQSSSWKRSRSINTKGLYGEKIIAQPPKSVSNLRRQLLCTRIERQYRETYEVPAPVSPLEHRPRPGAQTRLKDCAKRVGQQICTEYPRIIR